MKNCLGFREARGWHNEGKWRVFKNLSHQRFKTENMCFLRVTYSRSYLRKMHLKHKTFRRKSLVTKQLQKSLFEFCVFKFCLNLFSREELSHKLLAKIPLKKFLKETWKMQFDQKLKTQKHKTLSKKYKILKNLFGFDWQAIEHTHHIWSCTITQTK